MGIYLIFLAVVFSSIFVYVKVFGVLTTEIAVIITIIVSCINFLYIFNKKGIKRKNIVLLLFTIIISIYLLINFMFTKSTSFFNTFKLIIYCFTYYFFIKINLDDVICNDRKIINRIVNIYLGLIYINIFWGIVQVVSYRYLNIVLSYPSQVITLNGVVRLTGLFGEPAHLGLFCLPLTLFNREFYINRYKFIVLLVFSLMISNSTVCLIVAVSIFLKLFLFISNKKKVMLIIITTIAILVASNMFDLSRYTSSLTGADTSSMARIEKWKVVYNNMDPVQKLIGIGMDSDTEEYLRNDFNYSKYLVYLDYYPGFGQELIYLGIMGFILFNIYYLYLFNYKFKNILFFICFECMRLGSSITFNSNIMVMFLILSIFIPKYCLINDFNKEIKNDY